MKQIEVISFFKRQGTFHADILLNDKPKTVSVRVIDDEVVITDHAADLFFDEEESQFIMSEMREFQKNKDNEILDESVLEIKTTHKAKKRRML